MPAQRRGTDRQTVIHGPARAEVPQLLRGAAGAARHMPTTTTATLSVDRVAVQTPGLSTVHSVRLGFARTIERVSNLDGPPSMQTAWHATTEELERWT